MDNIKYDNYTLKNLRESVSLSQQELGWAAGISSVYISLIESGDKQLNYDIAEKLAKVYVKLMYEKEFQSDYLTEEEIAIEEYKQNSIIEVETKRETKDIMANHLASFYPEDVQETIVDLMYEKQKIEDKLNLVLETKRKPVELDEEDIKEAVDAVSLYDKINKFYNEKVQENVEKLKEEYKNRPKKEVKI